jgi:hypothetical protein
MTWTIQEYREQRNAALLSLDENIIRDHLFKFGFPVPSNTEAFWLGIHKAITACTDLPIEFRKQSAQWLFDHGSTPWDGWTL